MSKNDVECRVLSPTAILGYGFPRASFFNGLRRNPDVIAVDAGSTDPGPYYLGAGQSFTSRVCVKRDLRHLITQGVKRKIPVIVGTAGGCGARPHLMWCKQIVEEIASEEGLSFKLGLVFADVDKETLILALKDRKVRPLPQVPALTEQAVRESVNLVAQMGTEPIVKALDEQCDVILCGRCYDPAAFAALPISKGYDVGLSLHMGKILECAAISTTPGSGSDCVLGIIEKDRFLLEPLSGLRKFTRQSTAAHTLYEKSDPYHLPGPGGTLNLEGCSFHELPAGRVEIVGTRFEESDQYLVKVEGARSRGFRSISIAGTRDPVMIRTIDRILEGVDADVQQILKEEKVAGTVYYHVYGKHGVMGTREPIKNSSAHELGILLEAIGPTQEAADTICSMTRSTLLHYGYPGRISTAGNLAFPFSPSDVAMGEVFEFTVYHLMAIENQDMFTFESVLL